MSLGRGAIHQQHPREPTEGAVLCSGGDRDLAPPHQVTTEAGTAAAIQDRCQHIQGVGLPLRVSRRHDRGLVAEYQVRLTCRRPHLDPGDSLLRGLSSRFLVGNLLWFQRTEITLRQGQHLLRLDITHHHQGRVVGGVPTLVPLTQVLHRHVLQIVHPADDRMGIGQTAVGDGGQLFVGQRGGLVLGTQPALLLHHLDLLGKLLCRQGQVAHPVRLQLERHRQAILGEGLEIGGVVAAGKGVFASAVGGDDA